VNNDFLNLIRVAYTTFKRMISNLTHRDVERMTSNLTHRDVEDVKKEYILVNW
jgi:hypothetical protein